MLQLTDITSLLQKSPSLEIFRELHKELQSALLEYWNIAEDVVTTENIVVLSPAKDYVSLERNFFSLLFVYSYYRAGIPSQRRIFYAAINQCIRGMVTGCDNLLDNEYKKTIETSLPEKGFIFRSVLDIMASDRILFELLCRQYRLKNISLDDIRISSYTTLKSLLQSGAQEASEEQGVDDFLTPERVLSEIHHFKTGVLFQSPWAVPSRLEAFENKRMKPLLGALYNIGIGCQILDDMVDLKHDICTKRNNYVASVIVHGTCNETADQLLQQAQQGESRDTAFITQFSPAQKAVSASALEFLHQGFDELLAEEHIAAKDFAIAFIANQIGAAPYLIGPTVKCS